MKLETQRVGEYIVKAHDAIHFQILYEKQPTQFFAPAFVHQVFNEDEKIRGYEGLSIDISLSPKFLVPFVRVTHTKKAEGNVQVDDVMDLLSKHYGRVYTDHELFQKEVLNEEKNLDMFGEKVSEFKIGDKSYQINKVCTEEQHQKFDER